nr:MAG TPA: hypothetical protein [Bacteriophage sp.]
MVAYQQPNLCLPNYSPHIFSLRGKDRLIRFIVSHPTDRPAVIH